MGVPERYSTRVGSNLAHKYWTRLEGLAGTNALAYLTLLLATKKKSFMRLAPDPPEVEVDVLKVNLKTFF
jgi:hypothetical protein